MNPAETITLDPDTLATIDRWLAYRVWHSRVPGAQVAVGVGDDLAFTRSYGVADLTSGEPMRDDHLFHIASHSKTFTATLIMQLVEEGALALTDPIGELLDEFADTALGRVCVRELLEHTGGLLRDGHDADHWQHTHPFPDRDRVVELTSAGPKADPSEIFAYSNLGYSLLGLIIEKLTARRYAEVVQEKLLDPLALAHTAPRHLADREADYAACHSGLHVAREREVLPHVDTAAEDAATGFTSTASDLVRWFAAHRLGVTTLLSDPSKRLMQRPLSACDPTAADPAASERSAYGLGLGVETVGDRRMIGHGGGYPGHITKTISDPRTGLTVSVLTNAIDGPAAGLATGIVNLIDDAQDHRDDTVGDDDVRGWTGRYRSAWSVIDIAVLGGRLVTVHPTTDTPAKGLDVLEVDGRRLRIADGPGYGSVGEYVTRTDDGIRYGGTSMTRFDDLPDPLRA